jgi:hypothetical protein
MIGFIYKIRNKILYEGYKLSIFLYESKMKVLNRVLRRKIEKSIASFIGFPRPVNLQLELINDGNNGDGGYLILKDCFNKSCRLTQIGSWEVPNFLEISFIRKYILEQFVISDNLIILPYMQDRICELHEVDISVPNNWL